MCQLMVHAKEVTNNQPERGLKSPNEKAGAPVVDMHAEHHPALCHAVHECHNEHVPDKFSDRASARWLEN